MNQFFALNDKELFTWIGIMGGRSFTTVLSKGILRPFADKIVSVLIQVSNLFLYRYSFQRRISIYACHHTLRFNDA